MAKAQNRKKTSKTTKTTPKRQTRSIRSDTPKKRTQRKSDAIKSGSRIRTSQQEKNALKRASGALKKTSRKKPVNKDSDHTGRPTILTEELITKVSQLILAGAYIETACAAVGFSKKLYYEWLKLGARRKDLIAVIEEMKENGEDKNDIKLLQDDVKKIKPIYEQFSDSIEKAVVEAELRDMMRIDQAATKSWQAAAWKLERKYPQRWARTQKVEHDGTIKTEGEQKITIEETRTHILALMKDPDTLALAEKLIERMNTHGD